MKTNSDTLNHTNVHVPSAHDIREWACKASSRKKLAEVALVGSTLVLFGLLSSALGQALMNTTVTGSAPF